MLKPTSAGDFHLELRKENIIKLSLTSVSGLRQITTFKLPQHFKMKILTENLHFISFNCFSCIFFNRFFFYNLHMQLFLHILHFYYITIYINPYAYNL